MPTTLIKKRGNVFKKSDLEALKLWLIRKDYQAIATKSNCSKGYVSRIFSSQYDVFLTSKKSDILNYATILAQQRKQAKQMLAQNMSKLNERIPTED